MITRDNVFHACCALAIAISALVGVGIFWAAALLSVIYKTSSSAVLVPSDFWGNFCAGWQYWYGFVGALFGAAIALAYDRRKKKDSQRVALAKLREILVRNSGLMAEVLKWIIPGGKPNFTLDTLGLNLWIAASAGVIDPDVLRDLDGHRYQLEHINTKLTIFYSSTSVLESLQVSDENRLRVRVEEERRLDILNHVIGQSKESARILALLQG